MAERSTRANIGIAVVFAVLLIVGAVGVWLIMARQMAENAETAAIDVDLKLPETPNLPAPRPLPNPQPAPLPAPTPDAR